MISLTILLFVFIEDLNGWQIVKNGGDKWAVHGLRVPHPDETVQNNFVTSFR